MEPFVLRVLRRADLLVIEFQLFNLELSDDGTLVRVDSDVSAVIVVVFPPQYVAEKTFPIASSGAGTLPKPPIRTALAGKSRLAFRLPDAVDTVPLTLDALLSWDTWLPVLAPGALPGDAVPPDDQPPPAAPGASETAIEFPWRLFLSPDETEEWRHDRPPLVLDGNAQLWRTYLARKADRGKGRFSRPNSADVRALAHIATGEADWASLREAERHQIVQLTSNYGIVLPAGFGGPKYVPRPIRADEFSLSALEATGRMEGKWDFPLIPPDQLGDIEPLDLQQYKHVAAQGRDHFVRTVHVGFLCGTGHRASVIVTTERLHSNLQVVGQTPDGFPLFGATTYLLQTKEVVVQEPEIDYRALAPAYAFGGREMPLRSIRLLTTSATVVGDPEVSPSWLMSTPEEPVMFNALAVDIAGDTIEFQLPLMFVPYAWLGGHSLLAIVRPFRTPPSEVGAQAHNIDLGNQQVTFAPADDKPGSTALRTASFSYDIEVPDDLDPAGPLNVEKLPKTYIPPFAPRVMRASAIVPAVAEIIGNAKPITFDFDNLYLQHGFNSAGNAGQSFARFTTSMPLEFAAQRGGGLARPDNVAEALSRTLGPVSKPDQLAAGNVDLSAFTKAKFLGTIRLTDILPVSLPLSDAPQLTTRRLPDGASVETHFVWKPALRSPNPTFGILTLDVAQAELLLDATMTRSPSGSGSAVTLGRLRNAALSFAGAISVHFDELLFRAEEGKKLEVGAKGADLQFAGPLSFVNSLQSILPADGFDDPPYVTVDGQGVVAGYTLGVPSIGVGIFSLQNIALGAALSVPFTDRPAGVRFSVSERHKPFLISVSLFGGGGFFAMAVSANGLEQVEASLEFGGNVSLNLVIASGGVFVMAGIYFGLTGTSVTLTGYLRCGGSLEVLGLIAISVEFYLAFTYRDKSPGGSEVWGQASLTVCVEIAFFSKSVSLSVERRFAGSDGDPTFSESVTAHDWAEYLQAFAQ